MKAARGSLHPSRDRAREMRRMGYPIREIAAALNIQGVATVHRMVADIPPPNGKWKIGPGKNLNKWYRVRELRRHGHSFDQIASALNCSKGWIHRVLSDGASA
jgi:IS30 family transposase